MCKMDIEGKTEACLMRKRTIAHQAKFLLVYLHLVACLILSVTCQSSRSSMALNATMNSNVTLVSEGGVFEVGFTSGKRENHSIAMYGLAIWYAQPPTTAKTVVWVADRSMAFSNINGTSLILSAQGDLQVYNTDGISSKPVWTSNTANLNVTSATILDTGNLVLLNTANQVVWQSFDTPADTLLPNQTFAANSSKAITAWQNVDDWSEGKYSLKWSNESSLIAYWQNPYTWYTKESANNAYWSTSGKNFSYATLTSDGYFQAVGVEGNSSTIATNAMPGVSSRLLRLTLDKDGNLRMYSWSIGSSTWTEEWKAMDDICSVSGHCGPYAICGEAKCTCPYGFQPADDTDERLGCKRINPTACDNTSAEVTDSFGPIQYFDWGLVADWDKGPDLDYLVGVSVSTCKERCLADCRCEAVVTSIPITGNGDTVTCWLKKADLLNGTASSNRQSYLRIAGSLQDIAPAQPQASGISRRKFLTILGSTVGAAAGILALLSCAFGMFCFSQKMQKQRPKKLQDKWVASKGSMIRFTYHEIMLMTGNFENQIGKGGFGTVFKGHIGHPQHDSHQSVTVAVKRLNNKLTSQAEKEFLNEVDSIGRIHHVHLVSLLGYCAEADHRLLVYEYVQKGSLDTALFRGGKLGYPVLEWRPRFAIAIQTARGLAYLHDDCNQQIIHCDVKPENILLDSMNSAKVADFGISRIMDRDQTRTVTMHIRGTRGYLAPEYWMPDQVTITNKVDVFSYGMVLLEIISGRRNLVASPSKEDAPDMYFPKWAFSKIATDAFMDVVDPALTGIVNLEEVRRALQVAFWCINDKPQMRPSMSDVVQMLQGHMAIDLPVPRPEFFNNDESYRSPVDWSSEASSNSTLLHELVDSSDVTNSSQGRF